MAFRRTLVTVVVTVLALVSAWHTGRHRWHRISAQRELYQSYTADQRRTAMITEVGLPAGVFDFYRAFLDRGDRVYYQIMPSGFSHFMDLPTAFELVGDYYLLPSVQVTDLSKATVVISYQADPGLLKAHYITQKRAGLQPIFVSRIRAP